MPAVLFFCVIVTLTVVLLAWKVRLANQRDAFIRTYVLPKGLYDKLREKHPALSLKECQLVAQGLRQFFLTYLKSGRQYVSMPSQVVDDLWHEFILYTKNYQAFCDKAFGRFLHHTPAAVLGGGKQSNVGLRRCWWFACKDENIHPARPTRLPLLFAIDSKLNIVNGFRYATDCGLARKALSADGDTVGAVLHCGGDFSSASFDGGTEGFGDSSHSGSNSGSSISSDGSSSSDSSGSGGSGCGGGGCGGGGD